MIGTGRVCGTAAGIAPRLIHSVTPRARASATVSAASASQRRSGSAPYITSRSRSPTRTCRTASCGHSRWCSRPSTTSSTGRRER